VGARGAVCTHLRRRLRGTRLRRLELRDEPSVRLARLTLGGERGHRARLGAADRSRELGGARGKPLVLGAHLDEQRARPLRRAPRLEPVLVRQALLRDEKAFKLSERARVRVARGVVAARGGGEALVVLALGLVGVDGVRPAHAAGRGAGRGGAREGRGDEN
jgi:hypothetical protein